MNWCRVGWHTWVYDDMEPPSQDAVAQILPPKFWYEERHCSRCLVREYGETEADYEDDHTLATTVWSRTPPKKTK
jgi:hypothetical protein